MKSEFRNPKTERNPKAEGRSGGRTISPSDFGFRLSAFGFSRRGFTLLELLLAILVFSIVLGAVHVVFFSAFKLRNKTSDALERGLPLQQTLAIIKRDLANLVPPGGAFAGQLQSTPTLTSMGGGSTTGGGVSGSLNRASGPYFYTAVGLVEDTAPWGDLRRVSYFLAPATNDTPGLDLYRSVLRNFLPTLAEETEDQFLMSGVDAITWRYFNGTAWQDTWDSTLVDSATGLTNNLPTAIKLELQLHNENPAAGPLPPVELVVPILVLARTNVTATIE
jgi:prepilin-type N-terminal cleavage/methylation domain-containing protein